ncbi:fimbrial protein [Burkholderia sp. ABCPW 11]|uniref:fimbrial protein n=1 Tax=Burkholderia sp. ABCPW 11 TaxID=1637859 RepID=UPI00211D92DA|nr:fimbrial protein [Burkholderia sp. ABCPW 11]
MRLLEIMKYVGTAAGTAGGRCAGPVVALAVATIGMTISLSATGATIEVNAFGQNMSLPKNLPNGTVMSRYYISPAQVCGQAKCTMTALSNYPNGGSLGSGPIISTNIQGIAARLLINGQAYASNSSFWPRVEFSQPIEVQLLGNGRPVQNGSFNGTSAASPWYFSIETLENAGGYTHIFLSKTGKITAIDGTCSVPNQTVRLPDAVLNKFGAVGTTLGMQSFRLELNNCPKGYNRIGYMLNPVGGMVAGSPGMLPLGAGSTASGVNIQVTDAQGVAANFGTSIKLDAYVKDTGGSYAIPMRASYMQTKATVTPGTVNGAMIVLLDYQ